MDRAKFGGGGGGAGRRHHRVEVSETGVTDNTDIAQSTSSLTKHSNHFNITGTVQGGSPYFSGPTTTGFTAQD
ncbi:hypothetical protein, partial [Nocardia cyriacigeorgica]|uniref:hypothetical protein n=1 Tax=Nocardia cyriacigeorgica TaxID=135487 RepID=UPI002457BE42